MLHMNHQFLLALGSALLLGGSNAFVLPTSKVPNAVDTSLHSYFDGRQWSEPYSSRIGEYDPYMDDYYHNRRANDYWNRQYRIPQRYSGSDGRSWSEPYGANHYKHYWSNAYNSWGPRGGYGPWQDRSERDPFARVHPNPIGRYSDGSGYQNPYAHDRVRVNGRDNHYGWNNLYWNNGAHDPYGHERINPNDSYSRRGNNSWNSRSLSSRNPFSRDRNNLNANRADVNRDQNNGSLAQKRGGSTNERTEKQEKKKNSWPKKFRKKVEQSHNDGVVQGGGRETWSSYENNSNDDLVHVNLSSQRRSPLNSDVEWYHGPSNSPAKMTVYSMDGNTQPWNAWVKAPRTSSGGSAVSVRNSGDMSFPLRAGVSSNRGHVGMICNSHQTGRAATDRSRAVTIAGESMKSFKVESSVDSVLVELFTDGMPLNAVIELWRGPNNVQQAGEVYVDNGRDRPFAALIDTPGKCSIAIYNKGPVAYPIKACLEPQR